MPLPKPFVRQKTYHKKKQLHNQSETRSQELIRELAFLNRKLLDGQKQNQDLQIQLNQLQDENNSLKSNNRERERERESKTPISLEFSTEKEISESS